MENTTTTVGIKNYSQADLGQNPSVNLATGRLRYSFADLSVGNGNFAVGVSHVYVSDLPDIFQEKFPLLFWNKWKLNLSQCIMKENSNYIYLDENGEIHRFVNFDGSRYYDERNAKVVLTVNNASSEISDGVGNKLYFNADGLLCKSISCHNSTMVKNYVYDKKKLVSVYDQRTYNTSSGAAKSRIEFAYDDNDRLITMTSYANFNTKLIQLNYTYDANNNLNSVSKTAFPRKGTLTRQILSISYLTGYLSVVNDCETNIDTKFEFTDGRVTKQSVGIDPNQTLSTAQANADSDIMPAKVVRPHLKPYKTLKFNIYSYNYLNATNNISVQTDVTNENGITLTYFIDRKACITSSFEKVIDENDVEKLKTLTQQRARRTGQITGDTEYINGRGSAKVTDGKLTITLSNVDIARNENEKQMETFEYALWVKHSSTYPRMQLYYDYAFKDKTKFSGYTQLQFSATNAWQRVSIPITVPKGKTKELTSLSLQFKFVNGLISSTIYVNEIGFSPAPHSRMRIPITESEYMDYNDIKYVMVNDEYFARDNDIDTSKYMTEEDIMATYSNRYANGYMANGKSCFDVIYQDNTCRKANVYSLVFKNRLGKNASAVNSIPYQTYMQTNSLDNVIQTDYIHNSSKLTIRQTCSFKNVNDETKTSKASTIVDYKGKTIKETDEYGVSKNYAYDSYGNLLSVTVKDASGNVGSSVYYNYDSEGRLVNSHNGITGQQISYNNYDQVSSVTEGKPTSGNTTLQLTSHRVDNSYDTFYDNITQVAEYDGTTKYGNNTITYANGRVRTVTDGTAKYGVKHDVANKKVEYTQFDGNTETTIQTDKVVGQLHTSEFINGEKITTKVDNYGKIINVSKDDVVASEYSYDDPADPAQKHTESEFARKPSMVTTGTNTTEFIYDYDGELAGFTEKENGVQTSQVRQIAPDVTKYTYADNSEYFATVERDQDKMLNPRVMAVKYYSDFHSSYDEPDNGVFQFAINYQYDPNTIGLVNQKNTKNQSGKYSTTDYVYEKVSNTTRLKQSEYSGVCWMGNSGYHCNSYYTEDYAYADTGEITKITDSIHWIKKSDNSSKTLQNTREYEYNALHQLVKEKQGGVTKSYTYLADGRLNTVNGIKHNYDSQGRLHILEDRLFYYDQYGNRTTEVTSSGTKTYKYEHNLLTETPTATYKYNADGVRCEKKYNGITTKYMLDGNKILGETQSGHAAGVNVVNGKKHIKYIYDNEGIQFVKIGESTYELVKDIFNNVVMVVNQEEGEVACIYRYDAFGNCTVLDQNGNVDMDYSSVGNTNPIRWKSFYYDTETKFYYANGSYYDPTTGTYLDASPISTIFDNVTEINNLDRNAPVCNNILELASNPYTVATASNLSPDPTYYAYANAPWYIQAAIWYAKIPWYKKLFVGIMLLIFSIPLIVITGGGWLGIKAMLFEVAKGVILGIGFWIIGTLLIGEKLTWEGLGNAALDAFLVTSAVVFVASAVNYFRLLARTKALSSIRPPNGGAVPGTEETITLEPGKYGRYGKVGPKSNYITNAGASRSQLSLPPNNNGKYIEITVIKPIENVKRAIVAPWKPWGGIGGGIQYQLPASIRELRALGYIIY